MLLLNPNILDIWYRNSLTQDYWVFAKSDIDITILFSNLSFEEGRKTAANHSLVKKFIPVIGEACFYDHHKIEQLKMCINAFELERDPVLVKLIGSKESIQAVDRVVFLNKFFINTIFKKDFAMRNKKISYYLKVAQSNPNNGNLESIKKIIQEITHIHNFDRYEYLCKQTLNTKTIAYDEEITATEYALLFNFLAHLKLKKDFSQLDLEIIKKNLYWELWGIYTYRFFGHENISKHIRNLLDFSREIFSTIDQQSFENLAKQLDLI